MKNSLFSQTGYRVALAAAAWACLASPGRAGLFDRAKGGKEGGAQEAGQLDLRVDGADIDRASPAPASYAPVIERVMPSVVSVFAYKMVRFLDDPRLGPYMNDPFFQYFFGRPYGRGSRNRGRDQDQDQPQPEERKVQNSLGSGVIVTPDGYILTAHHVVDRADEVGIRLPDSVDELPAKVVGSDPSTDVAVLKVESRDLPAVTLADSERIRVGDAVLAMGNPFGVGPTVTMGIVSAKHRKPFESEESGGGRKSQVYEDFIQTDAAINFGNSGGALVDTQGRLVGINTAIFSQTGGNIGIGFAVPVNIARYVLGQLARFGKVNRGMLGVIIQGINADFADALKLPSPKGALVSDVASGSPAEKAGIQARDVIVAFNGRAIDDPHALQVLAAHTAPGTQVTLTYIRDGKQQTAGVTLARLGASSDEAEAESAAPGAQPAAGSESLFNGVEITELDEATRASVRAPAALRGVYVKSVARNSRAAQGGLQEGDVIVEIGDPAVPVSSIDQAQRAAEKTRGGHRVLLRVWREGNNIYRIIPLR